MGFFDSLFGGGKKEEPKKKKKKAAPAAVETAPEPVHSAVDANGLTPEVIAAISASVNMVLEGETDPVVIAAVTAAIVHAQGGAGGAVRFKRTSDAWAASGRQKIMDSRQFA